MNKLDIYFHVLLILLETEFIRFNKQLEIQHLKMLILSKYVFLVIPTLHLISKDETLVFLDTSFSFNIHL